MGRDGVNAYEVLVGVIVVVFIAGMIYLLNSPRRGHRNPLRTSHQLRAVHSGLVLYAQDNGGYYSGLDAGGEPVDLTVEGRLQLLLDASYFTGVYILSPAEAGLKTAWTTGRLTSEHYSYALLDISDPGSRRDEWRDTINTEAVIASDRLTRGTPGQPDTYRSLHSLHSLHPDAEGGWRGAVVWNDNHVSWETDSVVGQTRYAESGPVEDDDLFTDSTEGHDALMIHTGQ